MHAPRVASCVFALNAAVVLMVGAATPITPVPAPAAERIATVQVRVAPDHRDWTYQLGETARFRITVTADNEPVEGVTVSYTVGPEMMPAPTKTATLPLDFLVIDGGTMNEPGFLRCVVTAEVRGKTYRGLATAAFAPEKIAAFTREPEDFEAFWNASKDELAKVPMDARLTLLPDACTAKVNVYQVSFRTIGPNWTAAPSRIFGIYCEPKEPGKYPALLRVPGAGVRPYFGDKGMAERGAITLEIGVHGVPVNMAQEVYDQLYAGGLAGYWLFNLDDRNAYYYRRIYMGCLRANDFLTSRPNWNGRDLAVAGASQGGQLTLVTAGLDPRVTAISVTHPAFCDVAAELHGRAGGWPHPFQPDANGNPSHHATPDKIATATYYDAVNFARRVRVPGLFMWGYNDEVCPPTSLFAAYNVVTAPKELNLLLEVGHAYPPEQGERISAWLAQQMGLK